MNFRLLISNNEGKREKMGNIGIVGAMFRVFP